MSRQIILASSSPRRKELLAMIGLSCKVVTPITSEKRNPRLKIRSQVKILSQQKARFVAKDHDNAIVIAADTLVEINGEILGKPVDRSEALRMINKLNGKTHTVCTGFTIIDTSTKKEITRSEETRLVMRKLSEREIERYLDREKPFDKAGAYAVQGIGAVLFKSIEGDFFNVVGLPLTTLMMELRRFKLDVL